MAKNKLVTPMQKVSSEMKELRETFSSLGFENIGLNKREASSTTYREWRSLVEETSVRQAIKSDRTELFIKSLDSDSHLNTFQLGISFNYSDNESDNVITVSLTENFFPNKNTSEKVLKEAIYLEPMDISSFKTFAKELVFASEKKETDQIKAFLLCCKIASYFKEREPKLNRLMKQK